MSPFGMFQMIVLCIDACQMYKNMLLDVIICRLVLSYDSLSLYLLVWDVSHLLVLMVYYLVFDLYEWV